MLYDVRNSTLDGYGPTRDVVVISDQDPSRVLWSGPGTGQLGGYVGSTDAAHVFFTQTGSPIPKRANGRTALLGVHEGVAVYLLYNGVMGDQRVNGGNVLTSPILRKLPKHDGPRIIYGEGCRLGRPRLKREGIVFKQVPYEIKVS